MESWARSNCSRQLTCLWVCSQVSGGGPGLLVVSRSSSWEKQAGCRLEAEDTWSSWKLLITVITWEYWLPLRSCFLSILEGPLLVNSTRNHVGQRIWGNIISTPVYLVCQCSHLGRAKYMYIAQSWESPTLEWFVPFVAGGAAHVSLIYTPTSLSATPTTKQ